MGDMRIGTENGMSMSFGSEKRFPLKKPAQHHRGTSTQTVEGRDDSRRSRSIGSCADALSPKCHQLDSCYKISSWDSQLTECRLLTD